MGKKEEDEEKGNGGKRRDTTVIAIAMYASNFGTKGQCTVLDLLLLFMTRLPPEKN